MMKPNATITSVAFGADQPVADPDQDLYSRAPFAAGIAKAIKSLPRHECFVIGLNGPWGDGKTSVLRFVEHELRGQSDIAAVWYNPWRFVNADAMLSGFFAALSGVLQLNLQTRGERAVSAIADFGQLVGLISDHADKVAKLAKGRAKATVEQLRERLREALRKSRKRIVVFVDDIDRLSADEVASLFRVIKACADFPNVTYVLAFDRDMVARALGDRLASGGLEAGQTFLEKIVQIQLVLPPASRRDLDRTCMRGIAEILGSSEITLSDAERQRLDWAMYNGVSRRFRTPRQVSQYLNAVRFAVPLLVGEVNTVDQLLVEALRVCYPAAYDVIRSNQETFIGAPVGEMERRHGQSPQDDALARAKDSLCPADVEALDKLVETLFPRYHLARKNITFGREAFDDWARDKLVCSPMYGPRYFAFAVGSLDVADAAINAIMRDASSKSGAPRLRTLLDDQLDPLKQAMLVQKLMDRVGGLSALAASRLAVSLSMLSSRFNEPFDTVDSLHAGVRAANLVGTLCRRIESLNERVHAAEQIIVHAEDMWFLAVFMRLVDPAHPGPDRGDAFFGESELAKLRRAFVVRFEAFANTGVELLDPHRRWIFQMLYSLARAGGRRLVHERVLRGVRIDGKVAVRLLRALTQWYSPPGTLVHSDHVVPESLDDLALLVDVDEMSKALNEQWIPERLRTGPEGWASLESDDRILAQFWYAYPKWVTLRAQLGDLPIHKPSHTS